MKEFAYICSNCSKQEEPCDTRTQINNELSFNPRLVALVNISCKDNDKANSQVVGSTPIFKTGWSFRDGGY